jgi:hypothetical protein
MSDREAQVQAAAADIVPLARAIFGLLNRVRGQGYVPLPSEAALFFLYAAMAGVSKYLEDDFAHAIPPQMRDAANLLAPEIARLLREAGLEPPKPAGN